MEHKDKFSKVISTINKNVLRFVIGLMTLSLILGSLFLIYVIYQKIMEFPVFLLDVSLLFNIFNLALIIAVGYELIKSLILIITSETIPSVPIIQIAIIAVANKIITLDIKHTDSLMVIGLGVLIAALGLTHFLLNYRKKTN
jgi:uncharacterized membrane protein (DUF373 family)